jgi:hypothetical protein
MRAEGWYRDPYELHDGRWFSDGTPTAVVSDDGVETNDPPPDAAYTGPLESIDEGDQRADGFAHRNRAERVRMGEEGVTAAWEAFVETGGD